MDKALPKRKRLPHHHGIDRLNNPIIHFLTVCTKNRQPVLATDSMHQLLRAAWTAADSFVVGRYVIMPDHLHLFCSPIETKPTYLEAWVRYWKSLVTQKHSTGVAGKLWQRDFWDTQMRHSEHYATQWEYMRSNPVDKKLVENPDDWPFQGEMSPCGWDN